MMHQYHHPRYDEYGLLHSELDQEDRIRESLEWSNGELETSIAELETYVRELDENTKGIDDNEWKVRYEGQEKMNKQMEEQRNWLETELAEARRKLTTGSYPEAMNFNLDALTEAELLRLVKHLERMRNDFYSTLRDTEWKLDKESKEFHHFDEMRRVYKGDLKHANSQIDRLKLSVLDPSGVVSPLYPPGYFRWLETHTPGPSKSSKSPSRSKGRSKSKGEQRSPSRSPTRSKSRNEKKTKKKEEPPPSDEEEETGQGKSEGEEEAATEEEEEQQQPSEGRKMRKEREEVDKEPLASSSSSPSKPKRDGSKDRSPNHE